MAHGGDHRDAGLGNGIGNPFVVESPQILHRAAAASSDDKICHPVFIGVADGGGDFRRRLLPLYTHRQKFDLRQGIALAQNAQHIPQRCSGRGCDDGNRMGKFRQWLFPIRRKQSLFLQFGLELLKGHVQVAHAVRHHVLAIELIHTIAGKDGNPSESDDLHAVFRAETQTEGVALEHDAADGTVGVLQGKIVVTGGIELIIADLSAKKQSGEKLVILKAELQIFIDLGDLIDLLLHDVPSMSKRRCPGRCRWNTGRDRRRQAEPHIFPAAARWRQRLRQRPPGNLGTASRRFS